MTKENKRKLLYGIVLLGVSGGIIFSLIKLNKFFAGGPNYTPPGPGPGPNPGPLPLPPPPPPRNPNGLNVEDIANIEVITGVPYSPGTEFGCKTSSFGPRGGRMHWGMDVRTRKQGDYSNYNRNIVINTPGTVVSAVNTIDNTGWGKRIGIKTDNGKYLLFGHLKNVFVTPGMRVNPFDIIGISGTTRKPNLNVAPHVHFEVCTESCDNIPGGSSNYSLYKIDPTPYINTWFLS